MVYVFVDFVCALWSDVCELLIKSYYFVYVSDGCFSFEANAFVLLFDFCWVVLLWCATEIVGCVCDQFSPDVVFKWCFS